MDKRGLNKMDIVNLTSNYDNKERRAEKFLVIPYSIPEGNLAAYFPETNPLIPYHEYADKSQTPTSKSVVVKVTLA